MKFDVKIKFHDEWHAEVIDAPDAVTASIIARGWYEGCTIMTTSVHEAKKRLTDEEFRTLMDITMCLDPIPGWLVEAPIIRLLDDEAEARGYAGWIDAFHGVPKIGG